MTNKRWCIYCLFWGSHSGIYECRHFLGYIALWTDVSVERITSIFRVKNQPSRKPSCNRRLGIWSIYSSYPIHNNYSGIFLAPLPLHISVVRLQLLCIRCVFGTVMEPVCVWNCYGSGVCLELLWIRCVFGTVMDPVCVWNCYGSGMCLELLWNRCVWNCYGTGVCLNCYGSSVCLELLWMQRWCCPQVWASRCTEWAN
jgi:hypothetical protein